MVVCKQPYCSYVYSWVFAAKIGRKNEMLLLWILLPHKKDMVNSYDLENADKAEAADMLLSLFSVQI